MYNSKFRARAHRSQRLSRKLIAIDARLCGPGGSGDHVYWRGLLHGLSLVDPEYDFLLFTNVPAPSGVPHHARFFWMPLRSHSSRFWSWVTFPLAARRQGADVIHVQYSLSPLAGTRSVTTIHDVSFFIGPQWFTLRDRVLLQRSVPASSNRAGRVITVSETSKSEIEHWIPASRGKVRVTPLALRQDFTPMLDRDKARQVVAKMNVPEPYLLTVSTQWPRKNMQLAIDAVAQLSEQCPHHLVIAGSKGHGQHSDSARTHRTGYVTHEQLAALYACAELYLAPARHEGFGLPMLEAFASGCPVICSAGGSLPEVAGDAAKVVESWEPSVWADTIQRLLADSTTIESMRARGFRRLTAFDWKETARRTLSVYAEVIP